MNFKLLFLLFLYSCVFSFECPVSKQIGFYKKIETIQYTVFYEEKEVVHEESEKPPPTGLEDIVLLPGQKIIEVYEDVDGKEYDYNFALKKATEDSQKQEAEKIINYELFPYKSMKNVFISDWGKKYKVVSYSSLKKEEKFLEDYFEMGLETKKYLELGDTLQVITSKNEKDKHNVLCTKTSLLFLLPIYFLNYDGIEEKDNRIPSFFSTGKNMRLNRIHEKGFLEKKYNKIVKNELKDGQKIQLTVEFGSATCLVELQKQKKYGDAFLVHKITQPKTRRQLFFTYKSFTLSTGEIIPIVSGIVEKSTFSICTYEIKNVEINKLIQNDVFEIDFTKYKSIYDLSNHMIIEVE